MADQERVCCLCGDVGFPDKLFRCSRCRFRFQHSYCSNYYTGSESSSCSSMGKQICDWCQSQASNTTPSSTFRRSSSSEINGTDGRSEYPSGERIKLQNDHHIHHDHDHRGSASVADHDHDHQNKARKNNNSGVPSPRPNGHRRYKLLKDVMR